jgi:hypothetical protein
MRTHKRSAITLVVLAVLACGVPEVAFAHKQPHPYHSGAANGTTGWKLGDAVGKINNATTCGIISGSNYVKSAQAILWVDHDYAFNGNSHTNVDGYWGPNTDRAIKNYQSKRWWLAVDGCVGAATWNNMDVGTLRLLDWCVQGIPYYRYRWQNGYSEYITYVGVDPTWNNSTYMQWFDGWRYVDHPLAGGYQGPLGCY